MTTSDGLATVSWPATAFTGAATVTATPATLPAATGGFARGSYVVRVSATNADGTTVTRFGAPVSIAFTAPAAGTVPAFSAGGTTWKPLQPAALTRDPNGVLTVSTLTPGSIGLLRDIQPPTRPAGLTGAFVHGRLVLGWRASADNSGSVAGYEITLNGQPLAAAAASQRTAALRAFYPAGPSVYRVSASDAAGNASVGSSPVVVHPTPRPALVPLAIPNWAFQLFAWQQAGQRGTRPAAPRPVPAWYWRWANWRLHPFRVT